MRRGISIGIGLKVNDKFIGLVAFSGTLHPLYYLLANSRRIARYRWRKRIDIAIGTAAIAFGAIAVGAGKAAINNYLKHTLPIIFFAQPRAVIIVAFKTWELSPIMFVCTACCKDRQFSWMLTLVLVTELHVWHQQRQDRGIFFERIGHLPMVDQTFYLMNPL